MEAAERQPAADDPWQRFSPEAKAALEAGAKARAAWGRRGAPPRQPAGTGRGPGRHRACDILIN
eukprot:1698027-Prymnesium_polylepis.1